MRTGKTVQVQVIVGSETDLPKIANSKLAAIFETLLISFEVHVISAHRNPDELRDHCRRAIGEGARVFIAVAGWAAALPGDVAASIRFQLPVIGVPLPGGPYANDSLYAMASMPPGCPVNVVSDPGNAALAAAQILSLCDPDPGLGSRLISYLADQTKKPKFNINLADYKEKK
jgi:phosphoribosylaminoimidazole carboxylase PurE protein